MSTQSPGIEVHLYGTLRSRATQMDVRRESMVRLNVGHGGTVADALRRLDIADDEVGNVFRNGRLAWPGDVVQAGDRLGVFPSNMSLLYC